MKRLRLLYVEDNAINRLMIEKSLSMYADVVTEPNGHRAIERAEIESFDIYLIDLNLGDETIDGFDVLKALKWDRKLPGFYAALTAYSGEEWEMKCVNAGFDVYLTKPIAPRALWTKIKPASAT